MAEIRGNVDTRIRKLDEGEFDAIVLAEAGLRRLGLADRISLLLTPPEVLPAVGQGAIGIECRSDDHDTREILAAISDEQVRTAVLAERSLLAELRAGCHAPLGVVSDVGDESVRLTGVLLSADGRERIEATAEASTTDATAAGLEVARKLLDQGGQKLVDAG